MRKVTILTLEPNLFPGSLGTSVIGRAMNAGIWELQVVNLRNFAFDVHKTVDDKCFGSGPGMLLKAEIVDMAINSIDFVQKAMQSDSFLSYANEERNKNTESDVNKSINTFFYEDYDMQRSIFLENIDFIHMSPRGLRFNQSIAEDYAVCEKNLVILCSRYEGVDQRVLNKWNFTDVSIGDFILTNGDISAIVFLDTILRLLPHVLGNAESIEKESFIDNLLECDHYTQPANWCGRSVPNVLKSGNHALIAKWRLHNAEKLTKKRRPDLFALHEKNKKQQ
jgi:tRNA (guanine37-N1)-methyltransferase